MDRKSVDSGRPMHHVDPESNGLEKNESRRETLPFLFLVDSSKAHLPEFAAYTSFFENRFQVKRIPKSDLAKERDLGGAVVWQFMGLALDCVAAGCVVHDYRSLSTGRMSRLKDWLKKRINCKPDLRIFLNPMVRDELGFRDGVPEVLLDMGVPEWIPEYAVAPESYDWEYCYIGEISRERESHRMLDAFLSSDCSSRPLLMIGRVEPWIRSRYGAQGPVEFAGAMSQREVFERVGKCRYGICHLPVRRPYCFQTPTKLLEYAALRKGILANRHPSAMTTAERLGIHVNWLGADVFSNAEPDRWVCGNETFDAGSIGWNRIISDSGIDRQIMAILHRKQ